MKYIVTKTQLLESTKFPKGNVVPDVTMIVTFKKIWNIN